MNKKHFRQGDVLLSTISMVPPEATALDHCTLAQGEVTGHSHRITKGDASLFTWDEKTYLQVRSETALLYHDEHREIEVPKGGYEINIQREYQPEGWSYVKD